MDFITIEHASKSYGGVRALNDVSFSVQKGEIHGLVGENGSGKSTLIKILAGSLPADTGVITIDGKQITSYGPLSGIQHGISVIYQDLSLFPNLTVLENVCLSNHVKKNAKRFSSKQYAKSIQTLLDQLDVEVQFSDLIEELPIAKQQMVAIARALSNEPKLIIFDEPTTALTRGEINNLFKIINKLKSKGISIIFISHKLDEIVEICESITILRDGDVIVSQPIEGMSIPEIEKLMVGEMSVYSKFHAQESGGSPEVMLEVKGLCKKNNFADVSFSLMKGEVLGITGLLGSGRTELASALFGILPADSGTIYLENKQVRILSVQDAVTNGIAYVPEDRLTQGLVMNYPQRDNIVLATLANFTKNGLLDEPTITEVSQGWVSSLKIKTDDHFKKVSTLSGGNQQKVVLAKWLEMNPKVLILDGPTVGVDVGAKAGIFKIIHEMVEKLGMSVILISDEIKEITANCQRVLVMQNGRICSCLEKAEEIDDSNIQAILDMQKKSV
jgi:simple sugar transport system ATP-binding protein